MFVVSISKLQSKFRTGNPYLEAASCNADLMLFKGAGVPHAWPSMSF